MTCNQNNHGSDGEFFMENMLNQTIVQLEELYATTSTAEDLKSILAGHPIDISKKHIGKQLLTRTPMIITSNYFKFGRGHLPPVDEEALCNRCYSFTFSHRYKPEIMLNSNQFYLFLLSHIY